MNVEFKVHKLNDTGLALAGQLAQAFDACLEAVVSKVPQGRYLSIVKTKLEEACFFAKKGIAEQAENQQ